MRLGARRAARQHEERAHVRLGYARVAVVISGLVLIVLLFDGWASDRWSAGGVVVPLAVFLWLGQRMQRHEAARVLLSRAVAYYERALARLAGRWAGAGPRGARFIKDGHLYARDLDLFGHGSMFDLLSAARTRMGEETLAAWLLGAAEPGVIEARQAAITELAPRLDFRERIAVLGEDAAAGVHPAALRAWGAGERVLDSGSFRHVARALSLLGVLAVFAVFVHLAGQFELIELAPQAWIGMRAYFLVVVIVCGAIVLRFKARTDRVLGAAQDASHDLDLLAGVLRAIETEPFSSARLVALCGGLDTAGEPPSRRIAGLDKLMGLIDSRDNTIARLVGPFVLWDLHLAYALEDWRAASGAAIADWLAAVGEIEALVSLAAYRFENPHHVFAEIVVGSPLFVAEGLAHPLLPAERAVPNDVQLGAKPQVLMVSGSNMSGKSTLLRTVGINAVLGQAGAPVCARRLRLSPLTIGASIRVQDSLRDGTSRFYAEITRLGAIVAAAERAGVGVLFLIDEFLHGTNSHDRRIGAEAIVRGLIERGAVGLVTTHDLALTGIAEALGARGANVHFQDHLEGGEMSFDYRLRPGVVTHSNAIELMRSVGLDV